MFSGRLWVDSYWEPKPTPCARRWGEVRHACQARQVRQMRYVLHLRQVCSMLQPRQARHVRGTPRVCQVRPRT